MQCPFCQHHDTKVIDSRVIGLKRIRRRRDCSSCQTRFNTIEMVEISMPRVIKRNQERCSFDEEKIRKGILKSTEKRPIESGMIDKLIHDIIQTIHQMGDKEISSQTIGKIVMGQLKRLDAVSFIRFASVYLSIKDVEAFKTIIDIAEEKREVT